MTWARAQATLLSALIALAGCAPGTTTPAAVPASDTPSERLVIVGRIVTMADPPVAEALLIDDGIVTALGTRDEVLTLAGDGIPVVDIGTNVAYPGFIDAHAHWIGDRAVYGAETPAAAMDAALSRGWTSISEQWVNPEKLDELVALAAEDGLPLRVDAYLALNEPAPSGAHLGDWYADREPGLVSDHLRVRGLKITLDNGWGTIFHWDPTELTQTIGRANAARLAGLRPHGQHRGARDGAGGIGSGDRAGRAQPPPPPCRPCHPGDG